MPGPAHQLQTHAAFVWSVADLLRGDYKQADYGKVILPLTVIRRLDCVLAPTKEAVLEKAAGLPAGLANVDPVLQAASGQRFFNTSRLDLRRLLDDPPTIADQLRAYLRAFSTSAREVIEHFGFEEQIAKLDRANLLYQVIARFADLDLHPDRVSNLEMGYLYEDLIRRFSELSNETAGEHFTPREVIRLMVGILFAEDGDALAKAGTKRTLFDPACGTGGMLSAAEDHVRELNPQARLELFGQELNDESYAICRSDMMLKGQDAANIRQGNSFSEDRFAGETFDYLLANPPFGVEWKKVERAVRDEAEQQGFAGRFGAGLPRINDGSFLFLQHMISKMKPADQGGSRLAIVFNGSPLFTGAAGSGESEIRRWIIENDWLEAVVALPDQLFYNTGISTYFWIVTNRKRPERQGKVQLIDARQSFEKMRKSLGDKRKQIADAQIADITRLYADFAEGDRVKIFPNESFGFQRITVERPLRLRWDLTPDTVQLALATKPAQKLAPEDQEALAAALAGLLTPTTAEATETAETTGTTGPTGTSTTTDPKQFEARLLPVLDRFRWTPAQRKAMLAAFAVADPEAPIVTGPKGRVEPDPDLRDAENVPLPDLPVVYEADVTGRLATLEYRQSVEDHLEAEVHPWVPDAWIDHTKTKLGYEIPLTRHFYVYEPPRPLEEIDQEIRTLEAEIQELLREVTE